MLSKMSSMSMSISMAALALFVGPASADFKSLLARVPADANAVVLIDVGAVVSSPLGVREGWKARMTQNYAQKPLIVPPDASRVVMAALVDTTDMDSIWEISLMDLAKPVSLDLMARAERGYLDKLGQIPAVWSPINAYFIQFEPLVLAAACPADRQFAARWAARKPGGAALSAYLASTAGAVGAQTPIVMAMDLQEVTCATKVQGRLMNERFEALEGKDADLAALSQALGSISGVTLKVAIGEEITGKGIVDFNGDTAALAGFAKPLLLEMLSKMGAFIDDFQTWEVTSQGRQVSFNGKLSTDGLRLLLSVIEPPTPSEADPAASAKAGASQKDVMVTASKAYFKTVREILQKLDKQIQAGRATVPLSAFAIWMKRDSSAISRLPILNVDPDLVKFAADLSARLNEAARVMSQGTLQTQARTAGIRSQHVDSHTYSWDYIGKADNTAQRAAARGQAHAQRHQATSEERANAASQASEIFKGVKAEADKMRIEMTNRYQVEF